MSVLGQVPLDQAHTFSGGSSLGVAQILPQFGEADLVHVAPKATCTLSTVPLDEARRAFAALAYDYCQAHEIAYFELVREAASLTATHRS